MRQHLSFSILRIQRSCPRLFQSMNALLVFQVVRSVKWARGVSHDNQPNVIDSTILIVASSNHQQNPSAATLAKVLFLIPYSFFPSQSLNDLSAATFDYITNRLISLQLFSFQISTFTTNEVQTPLFICLKACCTGFGY